MSWNRDGWDKIVGVARLIIRREYSGKASWIRG